MVTALWFVIFAHISLFGAAVGEEDLPLDVQEHIRARVGVYNTQCKNQTMINLREDLDLWSLLIYNKTCPKKENDKPLEWVLSQQECISAQILVADQGRPKTKLEQLHARLGAFYDTESAEVMISKEGTIAFILANPGEVLGPLLEADPEGTRHQVEKLVADTFFPDVEADEELGEGAGGVAGGVGADE